MIRRTSQSGFTIVELLIVIIVIGILAALVLIGYNAIQDRAIDVTARGDLVQVAKIMDMHNVTDGSYPATVPTEVNAIDNFTLAVVGASLPYYSITDEVMNGELLARICQDLINEGAGDGVNGGGGTDHYVTNCGNFVHDNMQVNGWFPQYFPTPVTTAALSSAGSSTPVGDAFHPNQKITISNFYNSLITRLPAEGGHFPVTSFWDPWATPMNGGVMNETMPAATPTGGGASYCVQATYIPNSTKKWNVKTGGVISAGAC